MDSDHDQAVLERLRVENPKSVLVVAPEVSAGVIQFSREAGETSLLHIPINEFQDSVDGLGRFDFAVIYDVFAEMDKQTTQQMIARLRDLHVGLLWVLVPPGDENCFGADDALAQGFRMVDPNKFGSDETQWYEFSLRFYKPIPQWLNTRDWANPERWDKERW